MLITHMLINFMLILLKEAGLTRTPDQLRMYELLQVCLRMHALVGVTFLSRVNVREWVCVSVHVWRYCKICKQTCVCVCVPR